MKNKIIMVKTKQGLPLFLMGLLCITVLSVDIASNDVTHSTSSFSTTVEKLSSKFEAKSQNSQLDSISESNAENPLINQKIVQETPKNNEDYRDDNFSELLESRGHFFVKTQDYMDQFFYSGIENLLAISIKK